MSYKGLGLSIATSLLNAFAFISLNIYSYQDSIELSSTAYYKFFVFGLSASIFSVFSAFINEKEEVKPTAIIINRIKWTFHYSCIVVYALVIFFKVDYSVLISGAIAGFASIGWNRVGQAKKTIILGLAISIIQAISALASTLGVRFDNLFGYLIGIASLYLLSRQDVFCYWLSTCRSIYNQSFRQIIFPSIVHAIVVNTPNLMLFQAISLPLSPGSTLNLFLATEKISGVVEKALFSTVFYSSNTSFREYKSNRRSYFKHEMGVIIVVLVLIWLSLYLIMCTGSNFSYLNLLGSFLIALSAIGTIGYRSSCGIYFNYLLQLIAANATKNVLVISGLKAKLMYILIAPMAIFFLVKTHSNIVIWVIIALLPVQYFTIKAYNEQICLRFNCENAIKHDQ